MMSNIACHSVRLRVRAKTCTYLVVNKSRVLVLLLGVTFLLQEQCHHASIDAKEDSVPRNGYPQGLQTKVLEGDATRDTCQWRALHAVVRGAVVCCCQRNIMCRGIGQGALEHESYNNKKLPHVLNIRLRDKRLLGISTTRTTNTVANRETAPCFKGLRVVRRSVFPRSAHVPDHDGYTQYACSADKVPTPHRECHRECYHRSRRVYSGWRAEVVYIYWFSKMDKTTQYGGMLVERISVAALPLTSDDNDLNTTGGQQHDHCCTTVLYNPVAFVTSTGQSRELG